MEESLLFHCVAINIGCGTACAVRIMTMKAYQLLHWSNPVLDPMRCTKLTLPLFGRKCDHLPEKERQFLSNAYWELAKMMRNSLTAT